MATRAKRSILAQECISLGLALDKPLASVYTMRMHYLPKSTRNSEVYAVRVTYPGNCQAILVGDTLKELSKRLPKKADHGPIRRVGGIELEAVLESMSNETIPEGW